MDQILKHLPSDAFILDLGSAAGSFDAAATPATTIRVDVERRRDSGGSSFVQADAARLPFASGIFDTVVCNHSLEHLADLDGALREIGRVVKRGASLLVSVPDADTLTDRIYRWLARGGGHVNDFTSAEELARIISRSIHLEHVATRTLCTSLSFLNRANIRARAPRKLLLFLWGNETLLVGLTTLFRLIDCFFRTRLSVYGWALYFGNVLEPVDTRPWINVCVRCGRGHPSHWLSKIGAVSIRWKLFATYHCPDCTALNSFFSDGRFGRLH